MSNRKRIEPAPPAAAPLPTRATPSRPHAPQQVADERVEHIATLIASGRWSGRPTQKRLAQEWGVKFATVAYYTSQAVRALRLDTDRIGEIQAETIAKLGAISAMAVEKGELRAAVSALAERAKIAGAVAPSRVHHSGSVELRPIPDALAEAGARAREMSEADRARLVGLGFSWLLAWTDYTTRDDEDGALALLGASTDVASSDGHGDE